MGAIPGAYIVRGQVAAGATRRAAPRVVVVFVRWLSALSAIAGITLISERFLFHLSAFYWYPFFSQGIDGTDFSIFLLRFHSLHSAAFFSEPGYPFTYPAPAALIFALFYAVPFEPTLVFQVFCALSYMAGGLLFAVALSRRGLYISAVLWTTLPTAFFAYPEWFLINRGNMEAICWVFTVLGVWAYWRRSWYVAGLLLGVASALKLFPLLLLALLFSAKRFAALALGVLALIGTTVLSTAWIAMASRGIAAGLEYFRQNYALSLGRGAAGFDHSLFVFVKLAAVGHAYGSALTFYTASVAVVGLLLYWFRIRKLPRANQVVALVTCMVLLPPVSFEYTLVHLLIAWAVLVIVAVDWDQAGRITPPGLIAALVALAWLLATESYLIIPLRKPVRIEGPVKCLVLIFLLVVSVSRPWHEADSSSDETAGVPLETFTGSPTSQ